MNKVKEIRTQSLLKSENFLESDFSFLILQHISGQSYLLKTQTKLEIRALGYWSFQGSCQNQLLFGFKVKAYSNGRTMLTAHVW